MDALRVVESRTIVPVGGKYELALHPRARIRALRGGPNAIVVKLVQVHGGVRIDVLACGEATPDEVEQAVATAVGLGGLDDDPSGFDDLSKRHPLVARLHQRFRGARLGRSPTVFESFMTAVVEQLVTNTEARMSLARIRHRYGLLVPGTDLRAAPSAADVAAMPPHELRAIGIGLRRATTLRLGAKLGPRLEALRACSAEEAMKKLVSLRGVGPWTANKIAIEALGHPDGVLVQDAGVPFVTTMALTGKAGGDEELLACLEPFRPHRARVLRLLDLLQWRDGAIPGVPARAAPIVDPHRRFPWRHSS